MAFLGTIRQTPAAATELFEIVTPRTNTATISAAENLFAALSVAGPYSLEIALTGQTRRFLARTESTAMRRQLEGQLGVAYPQAALRRIDPDRDPARLRPDEQLAACAFVLRHPPYVPLRTFRDSDLAVDRTSQADPVLGILNALPDLPDGWRGLAQLILRSAPANWCDGYRRLALEHPLAAERSAHHGQTSLTSVVGLAALLGATAAGMQGYQWYTSDTWLALGLLSGGIVAGVPGLVWLGWRVTHRPLYDARLVQEKISRIVYRAEIRLLLVAPRDVPTREVQARLRQLAAAYDQFNLASGNSLAPRPLPRRTRGLRVLTPWLSARIMPLLTTRELAGLWHLPLAEADVPLLERTTARRYLPAPATVALGCRIGVSAHQGQRIPVALPDELLRRHLLLVAKTRRGKSSLLLQIARYLMEARRDGPRPAALVLVDPHQDLAQAALGVVPASRQSDVVALDLAETSRPFGLNLLDVGLGWDRDKAVANALAIFRREFDRFWGPRMEDAFRFALLTLVEANQARCRTDPGGRRRQHTILDVPAILINPPFRRRVLELVTDPMVTAWWSDYFDRLDRRLQTEIINPVQTKVQRFAGSQIARAIVGQPCSTVDPANWLRSGAIVIVNTAKGTVGADTAALIGGTLINLVGLVVSEQARLAPVERRPVTLVVDEFHTMPGADYEAILAELAKYGANLILATQSLSRLSALDRAHDRALAATVFANLDGLFVFHTSAEDARSLIAELGGEVDVADLVSLGEHQCYARLSLGGERLPTFSIQLDPPPASDPVLRDQLAAGSAARHGRARHTVEQELQAALARVDLTSRSAEHAGTGVAHDAGNTGQSAPGKRKGRNEHRNRKRHRVAPHQATLFDTTMDSSTDTDASASNHGPFNSDGSQANS